MSETNFEYARAIGEKLRGARQQRQMSLRDLAEKASMSASMLSQIETGKAYPSVRSIYHIAAALDLPVDYFFPEQDSNGAAQPALDSQPSQEMTASEMREATINRATNSNPEHAALAASVLSHVLHAAVRPTIQLKGGVTWSRLTAAAETNVEFLEITYACGAISGTHLSYHEGREFGLVLDGELVVQLGFDDVTLYPGDSIVFDSTTPHRLANKGAQPMRALWVIWMPSIWIRFARASTFSYYNDGVGMRWSLPYAETHKTMVSPRRISITPRCGSFTRRSTGIAGRIYRNRHVIVR
jgi:transcriptional regulator with XRE-family HTH domain